MTLYSRSENNAQSLKVLNTTEKNSVDKYDWDNTKIVDGASTVAGSQGYADVARRTIFIDDTEATLAVNRERGLTAPGWWEYMTYTDSEGKTRHKAQHLVAFKDAPANIGDADDNVAADGPTVSVSIATSPSGQPVNRTAYTPAGSITNYTAGATTTIVGEANEVYTLTGLAGSAAGTGAAFTVTRGAGGAVSSVAITAVGTGFADAETITILGSLIGGVDVTDNLVVTVTAVGTAAATFSVTATASTGSLVYQWQRRTNTTGKWANISGATNASLVLTALTTASNGYEYRVKLTSTVGAREVISNAAILTVDNNNFA
jgi:hypothetical protein